MVEYKIYTYNYKHKFHLAVIKFALSLDSAKVTAIFPFNRIKTSLHKYLFYNTGIIRHVLKKTVQLS